MLNNGKIRLMTKIALYEEKEEKRALLTDRFQKSDYVSYHVIKVLLSILLACVVFFGLWLLYSSETLLTEIDLEQLWSLAKWALALMAAVAAVYLLIALNVYQKRYREHQKGLRRYQAMLRRLDQFYDQSQPSGGMKEETK